MQAWGVERASFAVISTAPQHLESSVSLQKRRRGRESKQREKRALLQDCQVSPKRLSNCTLECGFSQSQLVASCFMPDFLMDSKSFFSRGKKFKTWKGKSWMDAINTLMRGFRSKFRVTDPFILTLIINIHLWTRLDDTWREAQKTFFIFFWNFR